MTNFCSKEEIIAGNWFSRLGLVYPCDIHSVIRNYAEVIEDELPVDADAILVETKGKIKVFIAKNLSEGRRRFTLAHELGHILIPWHVGNFVCTPMDPDEGISQLDEYIHSQIEAEANRFAAEFLMPRKSIKALFEENENLLDVFNEVVANGVSKRAAQIRLKQVGPPNLCFVWTDERGVVLTVDCTRGTIWNKLEAGEVFDSESFSDSVSIEAIGGSPDLYLIDMRSINHNAPDVKDLGEWRDILDEILVDLQPSDPHAMKMSISGVIGAAKPRAKRASVTIYTAAIERFSNGQFPDLVEHPKFNEFLAKRCSEIEK